MRRRDVGGFERRDRREQRRRRRRRVLVVVAVALGALVALSLWDLHAISHKMSAARDQLNGVLADAGRLGDAGQRRDLVARVEDANNQLASARRRARVSIPLRAAWFVPGLHASAVGVPQLITDAQRAAALAVQSIGDVDQSQRRVALSSGRVPLAELSRFQDLLQQRATALQALIRPSRGLIGRLHRGRDEFNAVATRTAARLEDARQGLTVGGAFLGGKGNRTYLFGFMNNAEMRDSGMVLSYGVATASGGRISFDHTGPIDEINNPSPVDVPVPAGLRALFGDFNPTGQWRSINATADFAFTGRTAAAMYAKATGKQVDGFVGVDVPALGRLLKIVGPISLGGRDINADNVGTVLLHDAYQTNDQAARREQMAELGARVMQTLTSGNRDLLAVGAALGDAAAGGHLRVWSARPDEERVVERIGLGGSPGTRSPHDTFHFAVESATASKLDYYIKPAIDLAAVVDDQGYTHVRIRVTVRNTAPKDAAPAYDLGPDRINTFTPGQYVGRVILWAPPGSLDTSALDESGLSAVQRFVNIAPGASTTLEFIATLQGTVKDNRVQLRVVPQPRLDDTPVTFELTAVGKKVQPADKQQRTLDRTLIARWDLS